ncbi:MAG: DNA-binding response regulator [Bacteroidetes bacterium 24-39-8]|nr:MAG: DNA-binding response regulator [Sphingobacteriia bacterium 35-40-5]OYZ52067.1 MAG: DNA-binding response regulator [Bacteroidetes bacterium 24-39-8]OZA69622.1 MAG: DNA-binding response regulator [Sphingobacteriia bacterium 39-39-8]HQR93068.1 response regulator transcription factor [Sediminibacterium sp.]HQS54577.1 response regulator transcription factor [Sediminibacterium sp.]
MSIKILYVEDEVFLGKIVKETLESRGFEVIMETDGADVLRTFEDELPDICVLDVMLPNRSGFEIAEDIRKTNDDIPILFLTAKTQTEDLVHGFKIGGNDYIRKPFSMEELIVRIENALRVKKEETLTIVGEQIHIGDYEFQINKQVLRKGSIEKKLSYRESELLKYLYLNSNAIIDRRELLNHIWGNDSFFNSRNLDVYITKIRSYLKDDSKLEIITIKGVGYRFVIA